MATINATVKQLNERTEYYDTYNLTTTSFIGVLSNIVEMAEQYRKGTHYPASNLSSIVQTCSTEKIEADRMKLTLSYKTLLSGGGGGGGSGDEDEPYLYYWSTSMSQYEFPLERYLTEAEAGQLAIWENGDADHKKAGEYLAGEDADGNKVYQALTGKALSVAMMKWGGTDNVIKYYPQATRTSIYNGKKEFSTKADKLNHIDDTPSTFFPELDCSWLKSAYDWTENQDGTWTLNETWIGAEKWNENLYGNNAWEFVT